MLYQENKCFNPHRKKKSDFSFCEIPLMNSTGFTRHSLMPKNNNKSDEIEAE